MKKKNHDFAQKWRSRRGITGHDAVTPTVIQQPAVASPSHVGETHVATTQVAQAGQPRRPQGTQTVDTGNLQWVSETQRVAAHVSLHADLGCG